LFFFGIAISLYPFVWFIDISKAIILFFSNKEKESKRTKRKIDGDEPLMFPDEVWITQGVFGEENLEKF
jgi:hypothetical protein